MSYGTQEQIITKTQEHRYYININIAEADILLHLQAKMVCKPDSKVGIETIAPPEIRCVPCLFGMAWRGMMWYGMVWYGMVW